MEKISVLISCYYSEKTIETVVRSLQQLFQSQNKYAYEIILVNDGSKDRTFEIITKLAKEDENIIGVNFSKNYGQLAGKMAGIQYVTGKYLVYMDDDGQHPVNRFFDLIEELEHGHDIVYAEFKKKKANAFKRITSRMHSKITEITLGKPKDISISSYYAVSDIVINALKAYNSPFPSPLGYMLQVSNDIVNVKMEHQKRIAGHSNYNLKKLFTQWLTVFTNFSLVPLRASAIIGAITAILGFLLGVILIINKLTFNTMPGYTSIICIVLFLGGLILLALGLIGEYIGRIYMTISNKPVYVIRNTVNVPHKGGDQDV